MRLWFSFSALLFSMALYAEPPETLKPGAGIATTNPLTVMLGLLFVVALIFGIAWFLKTLGANQLLANPAMKVLASMSVGPRERVVLVQVGEQQMLLGVAPGSVSQLYVFDEPVLTDDQLSGSEFQKKLQQILGQSRGAQS